MQSVVFENEKIFFSLLNAFYLLPEEQKNLDSFANVLKASKGTIFYEEVQDVKFVGFRTITRRCCSIFNARDFLRFLKEGIIKEPKIKVRKTLSWEEPEMLIETTSGLRFSMFHLLQASVAMNIKINYQSLYKELNIDIIIH